MRGCRTTSATLECFHFTAYKRTENEFAAVFKQQEMPSPVAALHVSPDCRPFLPVLEIICFFSSPQIDLVLRQWSVRAELKSKMCDLRLLKWTDSLITERPFPELWDSFMCLFPRCQCDQWRTVNTSSNYLKVLCLTPAHIYENPPEYSCPFVWPVKRRR